MKKLLILLGLMLASPAFAVDNTVIVTPGTGVTMRSKDVGAGVESMIHILGDTTGNPIYGTAGAANVNILTVQGIAAMTPLLTTTTLTGTLPAFAATPTFNLGTLNGAAIAATQTSQLTQETATATGVGTPTDTPCTAPATQAGSCTMEALLKALLNTGQYPSGATAITASATGTTAATTATLAGTVGKTTYICSYSIRANATAAITVQNTVTGVITATMTHQMWVAPAASGIGVDEQVFNPCVPASATNTGIAVVSGAPGAGGLVSATATGYQL